MLRTRSEVVWIEEEVCVVSLKCTRSRVERKRSGRGLAIEIVGSLTHDSKRWGCDGRESDIAVSLLI